MAAVFEELYAGSRDDYLEVLAHYYARSKNLPKTLEYLERAGERVAALERRTRRRSSSGSARSRWPARLGDAEAERRIGERLARLG